MVTMSKSVYDGGGGYRRRFRVRGVIGLVVSAMRLPAKAVAVTVEPGEVV